MYAEKNEYLKEAAEALYVANADEIVRQQCRARKDAEIREMRMQYAIQELENKNAVLEDKNAVLEDKNAVLEDKNAVLEDKNAALENEIASLRKRFEEMNK